MWAALVFTQSWTGEQDATVVRDDWGRHLAHNGRAMVGVRVNNALLFHCSHHVVLFTGENRLSFAASGQA